MDFLQFCLILVLAAISGIIARRLRQPLLIGYLFTGYIVATFGILTDFHFLEDLGKIGVALLLFLVGLEMNLKELPSVGKVALITGLGQIFFTLIFGFFVGKLLGLGMIASLYLAIAVSFSSTIIIVKLLSEKNTLNSLYGKISVGFLLIQDFVAIIILVFLSGISKDGVNIGGLLLIFLKFLVLIASVWVASKKILPVLYDKYIANSHELVFIVSIAWALGLAGFVAGPMGFSIEIGGFLAGLALSSLPEHLEITSKTRPLRDFFLTLFFLSLGTNLVIDKFTPILVPALVYSLLVLIGNPIVVMILLGVMNFRKRTSFLASVAVAQISEFSLIIVAMGVSLGHLSKDLLAITVLIAAITMTTSAYLISSAEKIFLKLKNVLSVFERKNAKDLVNYESSEIFDGHIILVGCLRTGTRLLAFIKKKKIPLLVVDFNPDVYKKLHNAGISVLFGDITDDEIIKKTQMEKARMVISTINGLSDNLILMEYLNQLKNKPISLFTAVTRRDALVLYEKGASYVVVPEVVAGEYIRNLMKVYGTMGNRFKIAGKNHFNRLLFR